MGPETEIMVRIHASDVANQAEKIRRKFTSPHASSLVSIIGQPPVSGSKLALEAYHIKSRQPVIKTMPDSGVLLAKHGSYSSLWMTSRATSRSSSCKQTSQVFDHLSKRLHDCGASLPDSLQRTWIYVRDIDNNYMDMVDVRRALFRSVGLDKDSHYVASTCIEGAGYDVNDLVTMDSLSVLGLQPGQVRHMSAEAHLCPTHNYGVTFERGTQIVYGDRSHYYISGTASIDKFGEVVHVGDVAGQSLRTLENIDALLSATGQVSKTSKC